MLAPELARSILFTVFAMMIVLFVCLAKTCTSKLKQVTEETTHANLKITIWRIIYYPVDVSFTRLVRMKDQLKHFFISLSRRPHANFTACSLTQDVNIGVLNLLFATDVSEVEF